MAAITSPPRRSATPSARPVAAAPERRASGASRGRWNVLAVSLIWVTSLVIVALWVQGGGIQALFARNAETLNTLGRLTGLVSANLLLYQVLLMARVPIFERGFGRDGITRMHRIVGFWSFWLLIAHIVLQSRSATRPRRASIRSCSCGSSSGTIRACCSPQPARSCWSWSSSPRSGARAAGSATSRGICCTSTATSASGSRSRTCCGPARTSPRRRWRRRTGGRSGPWWRHPSSSSASRVPVWRSAAPRRAGGRRGAGRRRGVTVRMRGRGMRRPQGAGPASSSSGDSSTAPAGCADTRSRSPLLRSGDDLVISARIVGDGTHRLTTLRPRHPGARRGPVRAHDGRDPHATASCSCSGPAPASRRSWRCSSPSRTLRARRR